MEKFLKPGRTVTFYDEDYRICFGRIIKLVSIEDNVALLKIKEEKTKESIVIKKVLSRRDVRNRENAERNYCASGLI